MKKKRLNNFDKFTVILGTLILLAAVGVVAIFWFIMYIFEGAPKEKHTEETYIEETSKPVRTSVAGKWYWDNKGSMTLYEFFEETGTVRMCIDNQTEHCLPGVYTDDGEYIKILFDSYDEYPSWPIEGEYTISDGKFKIGGLILYSTKQDAMKNRKD